MWSRDIRGIVSTVIDCSQSDVRVDNRTVYNFRAIMDCSAKP